MDKAVGDLGPLLEPAAAGAGAEDALPSPLRQGATEPNRAPPGRTRAGPRDA